MTYYVERLVNHKTVDGETYYLVKWLRHSMAAATWEPRKTLYEDVPGLVDRYDAGLPAKVRSTVGCTQKGTHRTPPDGATSAANILVQLSTGSSPPSSEHAEPARPAVSRTASFVHRSAIDARTAPNEHRPEDCHRCDYLRRDNAHFKAKLNSARAKLARMQKKLEALTAARQEAPKPESGQGAAKQFLWVDCAGSAGK